MENHLKAGDRVPQQGYYLEHNVFGSPSLPKRVVWVEAGGILPMTGRGFTWLLIQNINQSETPTSPSEDPGGNST